MNVIDFWKRYIALENPCCLILFQYYSIMSDSIISPCLSKYNILCFSNTGSVKETTEIYPKGELLKEERLQSSECEESQNFKRK